MNRVSTQWCVLLWIKAQLHSRFSQPPQNPDTMNSQFSYVSYKNVLLCSCLHYYPSFITSTLISPSWQVHVNFVACWMEAISFWGQRNENWVLHPRWRPAMDLWSDIIIFPVYLLFLCWHLIAVALLSIELLFAENNYKDSEIFEW